jgi:UDP-N-acetylglucosamine acyltransferase
MATKVGMTESIHPTAVVDPRARLGRDVRIGAYSIIGAEVTLEDACEVGHHAVVESLVILGAQSRIGHGAIVGAEPQDLKFRDGTVSGVRIGPRTVIREYVTIHRATTPGGWTDIGADCLVMASSHVAHDCRLGDGVIVINFAGIAGHCEIGHHATIGGLTGLHPFTRVGEYAYVGGFSKVVTDVPPYFLVDGVPATARGVNVVGLRRAGMPPADRRALREAYRILYRSGLSPQRALERMREEVGRSEPVGRLIDFIVASRRGICGPPGGAAGTDGDAEGSMDGTEGSADGAEGSADGAEGFTDGTPASERMR